MVIRRYNLNLFLFMIFCSFFFMGSYVFADSSDIPPYEDSTAQNSPLDDNTVDIPLIEEGVTSEIPNPLEEKNSVVEGDDTSLSVLIDLRSTLNVLVYGIIPVLFAGFIIYKILGFFMKHYIT